MARFRGGAVRTFERQSLSDDERRATTRVVNLRGRRFCMSSSCSGMADPATPPALLTVKEAAAVLKVGEAKLRGLIHKGDLLAYRVGVELRISHEALRAFIERNVAGGPHFQSVGRGHVQAV